VNIGPFDFKCLEVGKDGVYLIKEMRFSENTARSKNIPNYMVYQPSKITVYQSVKAKISDHRKVKHGKKHGKYNEV